MRSHEENGTVALGSLAMGLVLGGCGGETASVVLPLERETLGPDVLVELDERELVLVATLDPGVGVEEASFGEALAIDGERLVVGAPGPPGGDPGSAFVFERGANGWELAAELVPEGGRNGGRGSIEAFGSSVALHGDRIAVGCPPDHLNNLKVAGTAYVFERGGERWKQAARTLSPWPEDGDLFGDAVAIEGDVLVVGAPGAHERRGEVHVFRLEPDGELALDDAPPREALDSNAFLGEAVALAGNQVLVGCSDGSRGINSGSAFLYERSPAGWRRATRFFPPDGVKLGMAGEEVAFDGAVALVGAWQGGDPDVRGGGGPGAAYAFSGEGAVTKLLSSAPAPRDRFGHGVALVRGRIAVGAPGAERVDLFCETPVGWVRTEVLQPPDSGGGGFGHAVALGERVVVVGAPSRSLGGVVYVYER